MRIGIDIGGTFTDFVLVDNATGQLHSFKVLSTPHNPAAGMLHGLGRIELGADSVLIHGSTVATNAVLEGKGVRTALITTRGFGDILTIGRQTRSDIYDFFADRPEPLVPPELCFEVNERVDHLGTVLVPLEQSELPSLIERLRASEVESIAISLIFSFLYPAHERLLAETLRAAGFVVSASSDVLPEFREYERSSTTVINAYVSPILDRYISQLQERLAGADFRIMQSNGGTMQADVARSQGVRSILSGPAAGVVGAVHVARTAGFSQIVTFDMGGTSTDVALSEGRIRVTTEAEIRGLPVRLPVVDIHTVGSGGGSIAYVDAGGALRVGPQSAGADPGPVCYGRGGERPTVTDANLVLGRLAPDFFLGGQMHLYVEEAHEALMKLARQAGIEPMVGLDAAETVALGVVEVANAHMARALRVISIERGYDPGDFTLVSFGGAGGLHACDLARHLGIRRILVPTVASTLSAFGMIVADVIKDYVQTVMLSDNVPFEVLQQHFEPLAARALREVAAEGVPLDRITLHRQLDMRQVGQSYELTVPFAERWREDFHRIHEQAYGYSERGAPIEIVNVRLQAIGLVDRPALHSMEEGQPDPAEALDGYRRVVLPAPADRLLAAHTGSGLAAVEIPFYNGTRLRPGHSIRGPALIVQKDTTVFLSCGDHATIDAYANIVIEVG